MSDEFAEVSQKPLKARMSFGELAYTYARRFFGIAGGIANLLGIYAFGESHHWWEFTLALSPEMEDAFLMLAVGLGGPWSMILGGIAGAKLSELITGDRTVAASTIKSLVDVGFFLALLHCSQMSFGIRIFSRYLSGEGFMKIVAIYSLMGLIIGLAASLLMHARTRRRLSSRN